MKKIITLILLSLLIFTAALPVFSNAEAVSAKLSSLTQHVYPGGTFTVAVLASGSDIEMMQGKNIEYDSSLITMTGQPASGIDGWSYLTGVNFMIEKPWSAPAVTGTDLALVKFTFKVNDTAKIGDKICLAVKDAIISTSAADGFSGDLSLEITIVERPKNQNTNLVVLSVTPGSLTPEFKPSQLEYSVNVAHTVTELSINAVPAGEGATHKITGNGNFSYGQNKVSITVTAESGDEKVYTITVNRSNPPSDETALSGLEIAEFEFAPSFSPNVTEYSLRVPSDVKTLSINATPKDAKATVQITGNADFKAGENTVIITVTSESKESTAVYTLKVSRDRSIEEEYTLTSLSFGEYPLTPLFDASKTEQAYSVTVPYEVKDLSLLKYTEKGLYSKTEIDAPNELQVGSNEVIITVFSEGGSRKTDYRLTIVRSARILNSDTSLKSITCNYGELTPAFSSSITAYALTTKANPGVIEITAEPTDPAASVESLVFIPNAGMNVQSIICTAENGSTQTYLFYIFTDASIESSLILSGIAVPGQTLKANLSGMESGGTYAWYINGSMTNNTSDSYTVLSSDSGKTVYAIYTTKDGEKIMSQALTVYKDDPNVPKDPQGIPVDDDSDNKNTDVIIVIIIALVCIVIGCGLGAFFTKRKYQKNP